MLAGPCAEVSRDDRDQLFVHEARRRPSESPLLGGEEVVERV
jgi:hypothetical protein